ncbi:MAG: carbohydrate ABC transporter permease [Treponema sp.]|jgi:raffinose/stachyose/melibiose transport system permease protein|nr:carbohydrate ABC transporter permease [Treponema sp.]
MKKVRPVTVIAYVVAVVTVLLVLFPLYLTAAVAFKTPEQSAQNFFSPPTSFYFENFKKVMSDRYFFNYFFNSFFITLFSVVIIAVLIPMVSFSIARNGRSKYYKAMYLFFVSGIFVPFQVLMVPLAQFASRTNLLNRHGLVLIYIAYSVCQGAFLFVAYYKSVPLELEEAAEIDGCDLVRTFFLIIYPIVKPMTVTIIILNTLWIWNDFLLPLIILNKHGSSWTMPLFQYNFKSQYTADYNLAFAAFMFSIVPMLVFYAFLQRYIIQGLTAGSVKS